MPSIRENWTDLIGNVISSRRSPGRDDFVEIEVNVQLAEPVAGVADLLSIHTGRTIVVHCRRSALQDEEIPPGSSIRVRARRGQKPDQIFAHTQHIHIGS